MNADSHKDIFVVIVVVIVPQLEDMTQDDDMGRCVCVFMYVYLYGSGPLYSRSSQVGRH